MLVTTPRNNIGFTLIEVLIALFVLAIGLLGMATLMMNSMQSSQGASQRSAATVSAYDLAERMRANRSQATAYAGNLAAAALPACFTNLANTTGCSNADTATLDRAQWWANLQVNIPGAAATVQQINATTFCLVIFWQEPGVANTVSGPGNPCGAPPEDRAYYTMQVTL